MAFQGFQLDAFQPLDTPGQGGDPAPLPHLGLLLGAASGSTLTPATGHLTFAGYVPALVQNRSYAASTGHLTFTGRVPTLTQPRSYTPTVGHLTFAGYVPTLVQSSGYTPATGHLSFAGYASTITQPRSYTPTTGHLTFAGYVPTVGSTGGMYPMPLPSLTLGGSAVTAVISPATGHLTFTGYVPTQGNQAITVEWDDVGADDGYRVKWGTSSGSYSWSADVATDVLTYTITSLTYGQTYYIRIYALVGGVEQDPSAEIRLTAGWCFLPTVGHLTFSGKVPTVAQTGGASLTPTTGHLTFAGYAAGIDQDRSYTPTTGHLTFAGYAPTLTQGSGSTLSPTTGHLTFAGYVPTISQPRSYTPAVGHLTFTGRVPTLVQARVVAPSKGALFLVGYTPGLTQSGPIVLTPSKGALYLVGHQPTVTGAGADTVFGGVPGFWPQPGSNKGWLRKVAREVSGPDRTIPQRAQEAVAAVAAGYVGAWDQARAEAELRAALLAQSIRFQQVYTDLLAKVYERLLAEAMAQQAIAAVEQAQLEQAQAVEAARLAAWERDEDDALTLLLLAA